jgi:hypothetical protein
MLVSRAHISNLHAVIKPVIIEESITERHVENGPVVEDSTPHQEFSSYNEELRHCSI